MISGIKCYVNCDDSFIAWKINARINDLRGFAIIREKNGMEEIVNTWVGPAGGSSVPGDHRPSTEWPIQKFQWTDYLVKENEKVRYKVIPMTGPMNALSTRNDLASSWTEPQVVGPKASNHIEAFFNRGIVAAQWLSRRLGGEGADLTDKSRKLNEVVESVGDPVRNYLSGPIRKRLLELLQDAKKRKIKVYAALYELEDPELMEALLALKKRAYVVLANGSVKKRGMDQNRDARSELEGVIHVYDRMVAPKALGHNKFMVLCDEHGSPKKVWTGSTNWTKTGLCTQANNAILIDNPKIAMDYKKQWDLLKKSEDEFPEELVESNSKKRKYSIDGTDVSLWFTRTGDEEDLDQARELINGAKKAILFLMFNPGPAGTLLNTIVERNSPSSSHYDPTLYTHGVVNQDPSTEKNPVVGLFHRGTYEAAPYDVVLPAAVNNQLRYWIPELQKKYRSWAMVHSKVIVLDPFSDHPVVMTGSHNLGRKASSKNDENFVIIENHPQLAAAYAVNIMSIYNQYRWRFRMMQHPDRTPYEGTEDNDTWQDGYLEGMKAKEMDFWLGI